MAAVTKQDSNTTESRWSVEDSFKTADASAVWNLIEPNSFGEASAKFNKVVRSPIRNDRQREKGVLTDLDCAFGFQTDLTQHNCQELLQGLFYAALRKKTEFGNGSGVITGVVAASDTITAGSGFTFVTGDLVFARNFSKALGNNGLHRLTAATGTALTSNRQLADETPSAAALVVKVGVQTAAGDIDVDASGAFPALTSTTLDFTTQGFTPGEYIWIGGDDALSFFPGNAVNNCCARIRTIAANRLTLDKCSKGAMVTEAQAGSTIQLFYGRVLKNELGTLIVRPTYQLERQLNASDDALPAQIQSEYFTGGVFAQGTINYNQADKVTLDAKFVAADQEVRTGATGLKTGTRPAIESADAQNTTSDLKRVKLALVTAGDEAPTPLVSFIESASVDVNNMVEPLKALTVLGAFEMSSGDFAVSGSLNCFFASVSVLEAVRDNLDCTLDLMVWKNNAGWVFDLPLITLSDGSVQVAKDKAIMIPLNFDAASGESIDTALDYTAAYTFFDYLPNLAETPNTV